MMKKIFSLIIIAVLNVNLIFPQAALAAQQKITVDCSIRQGLIKKGLAGAAMGGNAYSYNKESIASRMTGLVNTVRLEGVGGPGYSLYDTETGEYDFSKLFEEIDNIHATGAEIIADIFYMPKWLSSQPESEQYFYAAPADYDAWEAYIREIVTNINISNNGARRIEYWEVWNEPSGNYFFTPWRDYNEFYYHTAKAIKAADPTAKVGGYADNPYYQSYIDWARYQFEKGLVPDFITLHFYGQWTGGPSPEVYKTFSERISDNVYSVTQKRLPVFYTEWNLNAEKPTYAMNVSSAYAAQALCAMQESDYVDKACFFRIEPYGGGAASLLSAEHTETSCARVFEMFNKVGKTKLYSQGDGCKVLAAGADKGYGAIVSYFDPEGGDGTKSTVISFKNHNIEGKYKLSVYMENSATADVCGDVAPLYEVEKTADIGSSIDVNLNMETNSVAFVEIEAVDEPICFDSSENLIENGSLETGAATGWTAGGAYCGEARRGEYSLRMGINDWNFYTVSDLKENTEYMYSAWVKTTDGAGLVYAGVKDFGGTEVRYNTANTGYTKIEVRFRTGAGKTAATVYVGASNNTDYCYADDLELRELEEGENLLPAGDFEKAKSVFSDTTAVSDYANSGSKSAKVAAGKWPSFTVQNLEPSTEYIFSAYVKAGAAGYIDVKEYGGEEIMSGLTSPDGFKKLSIRFKTGESNTSAKLMLGNTSAEAAYFDDVKLTKAIYAENMLLDSNFENNKRRDYGTGTVTKDAANAKSGEYALALTKGQWSFAKINVEPSATYHYSAWVKNTAAGMKGRIGVKNYGGTEKAYSVQKVGEYTYIDLYFTTGANNTQAEIYLGRNDSVDGTGYFDDIKLVKASDEENYIVNSGLELGERREWTDGGITDQARSGSYGLQVGVNHWNFYTVTGLTPDTEYCFSGYIKSAVTGDKTYYGVKEYDASGTDTMKVITDAGDYEQFRVYFRTGADNTTAKVYVGKSGSASGEAYCDDFELRPVNTTVKSSDVKVYKNYISEVSEIKDKTLSSGDIIVAVNCRKLEAEGMIKVYCAAYDSSGIVNANTTELAENNSYAVIHNDIGENVTEFRVMIWNELTPITDDIIILKRGNAK